MKIHCAGIFEWEKWLSVSLHLVSRHFSFPHLLNTHWMIQISEPLAIKDMQECFCFPYPTIQHLKRKVLQINKYMSELQWVIFLLHSEGGSICKWIVYSYMDLVIPVSNNTNKLRNLGTCSIHQSPVLTRTDRPLQWGHLNHEHLIFVCTFFWWP